MTRFRSGRAAVAILSSIVFVLSILYLFPLYWMVVGSFTTVAGTLKVPPDFFPNPVVLGNYGSLLNDSGIVTWFKNSVVVGCLSTILAVGTSASAGYALGMMRFPGSNVIFGGVLLTMLVPSAVTVIPLFLVMHALGWVDSYQGIIAPGIAYAFGVFLVRQFTHTLPTEIFDSARVDGAGEVRLFWSIVVPLLRPALAAVGIFAFFSSWNDFLWQLVVINSDSLKTLPVGLASLVFSSGATNNTLIPLAEVMAGATIAFVPMLIAFLLLQRQFLDGVSAGAVNGI
jgi:multiple sugar transport system permease protein